VLTVGSAPATAQTGPTQIGPTTTGPTQSGPTVTYVWPVEGTVVDPFRPPTHSYGPGNRGLEFATQPGASFWAAARGVVSFAGQVGGRLHVTVSHPDGLRVSYSGVATIAVRRGERVHQGQLLGTTGDRLHVGVRQGETYLDPAGIFDEDGGVSAQPHLGRPRLVPSPVPVYRLQLRWLHSDAGIAVL